MTMRKDDYYKYDKTLKSPTKDIQTLERQIIALEGSTYVGDKIRKVQLEEKLDERKNKETDKLTNINPSSQKRKMELENWQI